MEARRRYFDECEYHHKDGDDVVPRNPQYSLITIRHDTLLPLIFPPINHENLHDRLDIFPSPSESESDSETASSVSTFSPPSSPGSSSPVIKATGRITLVEILVTRVNGLMRFVWSYFVKWRGAILNFRTVAFVSAVLYFRERRRSRLNVDAVKLRDKKIQQLLDQISQMNQILLGSHRAGTNKTIGLGMNV